MFCNRLNSAFIKLNAGSIMAVLLAICISCGSLVTLQYVYAGSPISVVAQHPFIGSDGKVNIVGVVKNNGSVPVEVILGLNVVTRSGDLTIKQPTYGRIIYPSSVSPFKFAVEPSSSVSGSPFILNSKEVLTPYYKVLSLSYSNMPVGSDKALVGTAKNVSPFDLHNVTILASVHESNGTQIDSVRSQLFPVIRTDQTVAFTAVPDPAIKQNIAYFSCADIDVGTNYTLNTLAIGNGQFIVYQMYGAAQISDLKFDNATDSIVFGIKHYNPDGGLFRLMIPEMSINQPVSVILDGKLYTQASVKMDGKTVHIDFFVPPARHQVQIKTLWQ
jgi:hypothetical protein